MEEMGKFLRQGTANQVCHAQNIEAILGLACREMTLIILRAISLLGSSSKYEETFFLANARPYPHWRLR